MKSTAQVAGHPLHPMLIPYPFALLTAATAFDLLGRRGDRSYGRTAGHMLDAGLLTALAAAVPGIIDYVGSVPKGSATRHARWHAAFNSSALVAFALARRERRADGATSDRGLQLSMLGTALLGAGGWLGGELVYHHRVGVHERRLMPRIAADGRMAVGARPAAL
jgi:uncharacterized membrane protein